MTTAVTVDQLRNLTDRAGHGLTPEEQQRLRDGIDQLAAAYQQLLARLETEHGKSVHNATHAARDETRLSLDGIAAGLHIAIAHAITAFEGHETREAWTARQQAADLTGPGAATQATGPATSPLRDQLAAALYERERPPRDPHWPDAYPMDREVFEPMADTVLTALTQHLDIGDAQAWCKYCRRAWDSPAHRCESDAEQRVYQVAELRDRWLMAGPPPLGQPISRWWDKRLAELGAALRSEKPAAAWTPPPPGDTREQLPDHILALLDIPPYTSTACETAELLAAAVARHPEHAAELGQWEERQRQRCRINNKYTGVLCQHTQPEPEPEDLTGAYTPGCDCGHDGMGVSWHGDDCRWRRGVVDCPGRPTPG